MSTAGFVLAGGRSTRMGQDKALLLWRSRYLIEEIAAIVKAVTGSATLVGRPELYRNLDLPCLPDVRHELGPLAGIEAALESKQGEWNLIVGCDMPDISTNILRRLLDEAGQRRRLCIVAKDVEGQVHPLCAVYHCRCLPLIKNSLDKGCLKLMKVLEELGAEYVPIQTKLTNINTPEEWRQWQLSHNRA